MFLLPSWFKSSAFHCGHPGCASRGKYCDSDQLAYAMLLASQSHGDCLTTMAIIETWPFTSMGARKQTPLAVGETVILLALPHRLY